MERATPQMLRRCQTDPIRKTALLTLQRYPQSIAEGAPIARRPCARRGVQLGKLQRPLDRLQARLGRTCGEVARRKGHG